MAVVGKLAYRGPLSGWLGVNGFNIDKELSIML